MAGQAGWITEYEWRTDDVNGSLFYSREAMLHDLLLHACMHTWLEAGPAVYPHRL